MAGRGPKPNHMSERSQKRFGGDYIAPGAFAVTPYPQPPELLPERGKDYWREHAEILTAEGRLTPPTYAAFEELCFLVAERDTIRKVITSEGRVLASSKLQRRHPLTEVEEKISRRIYSYERDFGLVPSARAPLHGFPVKVGFNPFDDDDPFA